MSVSECWGGGEFHVKYSNKRFSVEVFTRLNTPGALCAAPWCFNRLSSTPISRE